VEESAKVKSARKRGCISELVLEEVVSVLRSAIEVYLLLDMCLTLYPLCGRQLPFIARLTLNGYNFRSKQ
jgi:hypothetical protein